MISAFLAIAIVCSVVGVGYGVLEIFAASMSDNPSMGQDVAAQGAWTAGICAAVFLVSVGIAIYRAFH